MEKNPFFDQPKSVWATAFACVVGFMSIGLVDPILTSIAEGLDASPQQVSLLFSSYFLVTSLMMLVTGFVSSRLGGRKTLLLGATLIVIFATLSGTSNSVAELVLYRAGWGLGNALFVATALAVIVSASRHGTRSAVLVYEAAMGIGLSAGPLLGAALGAHAWRYPFFGTAALMAIGGIALALYLPAPPPTGHKISFSAPLRALRHRGLFNVAVSAFFYYYAFFTVLAFVPFVLGLSAHAIGLIFFGWGVLLAIFSVIIVPRLQARHGALLVAVGALLGFSALLLVMGLASKTVIAICVVLSGAVMGICNTVYTEMAMEVSDVPRPVASAGYYFLRWLAGVAAPFAAPTLAEHFGTTITFSVAAIAALLAPAILLMQRKHLGPYGRIFTRPRRSPPHSLRPLVMAAVHGNAQDDGVMRKAIETARSLNGWITLAHVRAPDPAGPETGLGNNTETSRHLVNRSIEMAEKSGIAVASMILEAPHGRTTEALLERARVIAARILVVGTPHENAMNAISDRLPGNTASHPDLEIVLAT